MDLYLGILLSGVSLGFGIFIGVLTCNMWRTLVSFLGLILTVIFYGWAALAIGCLVAIIVMTVFMIILHKYESSGSTDKLTPDEKIAKNPRCVNCHAKTFCPMQPGAILDKRANP